MANFLMKLCDGRSSSNFVCAQTLSGPPPPGLCHSTLQACSFPNMDNVFVVARKSFLHNWAELASEL